MARVEQLHINECIIGKFHDMVIYNHERQGDQLADCFKLQTTVVCMTKDAGDMWRCDLRNTC